MPMIAPDRTDWWTRRRQSELSRRDGGLVGAGLSKSVLEAAAKHVGYPLTFSPRSGEEYDEEVTLGPWRGNIHDECFVHFDSEDARLREAVLAAILQLHAFYLGAPLEPGCVTTLQDRLVDGTTLRLRSLPHKRQLILKRYRNGAGWWERLTTPGERVCG